MKLLSADDKESILSIKETNNLRRIKEALTIKDLGVQKFLQRKQKQLEIMFI